MLKNTIENGILNNEIGVQNGKIKIITNRIP